MGIRCRFFNHKWKHIVNITHGGEFFSEMGERFERPRYKVYLTQCEYCMEIRAKGVFFTTTEDSIVSLDVGRE